MTQPISPSVRVGQNVARLRRARGLTTRALADRLQSLGHRIANSSLSKIEQGERKVDVDDLLALSLALGVNPNRLLMPERANDEWAMLAPKVAVPAGIAWHWADGNLPVVTPVDTDTDQTEAAMMFRQRVRPVEHQVRAEHAAHRAAQQVRTRVDLLLDAIYSGADEQRRMVRAGDLRRSLVRLISEARDLMAANQAHEPALLHIARADGFDGMDDLGVVWADGETVLRENDSRADGYAGPGVTVTRIHTDAAMRAAAERTVADFFEEYPALTEGGDVGDGPEGSDTR